MENPRLANGQSHMEERNHLTELHTNAASTALCARRVNVSTTAAGGPTIRDSVNITHARFTVFLVPRRFIISRFSHFFILPAPN